MACKSECDNAPWGFSTAAWGFTAGTLFHQKYIWISKLLAFFASQETVFPAQHQVINRSNRAQSADWEPPMELPPPLRQAVDRALNGVALAELAATAASLSQRYRQDRRDG